jgi:hypothetical protein
MKRALRESTNRQNGFLLPLSITGVLLLVTGNFALQLTELHLTKLQVTEVENNNLNDQLLSAAHLIGDYIIPPNPSYNYRSIYSCLSPLAFEEWYCQISSIRPVVTTNDLTTTVNKYMQTSGLPPITIKNWVASDKTPTGGLLTLGTKRNNVDVQKTFYIRFPGTGTGKSSTVTEYNP